MNSVSRGMWTNPFNVDPQKIRVSIRVFGPLDVIGKLDETFEENINRPCIFTRPLFCYRC